jgi:hypothetical protein
MSRLVIMQLKEPSKGILQFRWINDALEGRRICSAALAARQGFKPPV